MSLANADDFDRVLKQAAGADAPPESDADSDDESDQDSDEGVVVPQVDESERMRIRQSNDRDQALEEEGETAPHNQGYDDAAKGSSGRPKDR